MQLAPWLGFIPGTDGQIMLSQGDEESPLVNLLKSTTTAIVSNPNCSNPASFYTMSKQAEAAGKIKILSQSIISSVGQPRNILAATWCSFEDRLTSTNFYACNLIILFPKAHYLMHYDYNSLLMIF